MSNQSDNARPVSVRSAAAEHFSRQGRSAPRPEEFVKYVTSRPVNAHPELPVHLERVFYARDPGAPAYPTGRREWVNSYPSQELADSRILFLEQQSLAARGV